VLESEIKREILLELGNDPDFMIWNHPTGVGRTGYDASRVVRFGLEGSGDIIGVVRLKILPEHVGREFGVAISIETKTKTGKQSEQQKRFERAFTRRAGGYFLSSEPKTIKQRIIEWLGRE
jgi:hypothetical protein